MKEVTFDSGERGYAYIAKTDEPYPYIYDDPVQRQYLEICIEAAKKLGPEVYENFLQTTYIEGVSLEKQKEVLHIN